MAHRVLSRATAVAAALLTLVVPTSAAHAAAPVPVVQEGWAWFESRGSLAPPTTASGIEEGQLAVANLPTGAEKVSFLQLDAAQLGSSPPAASVARLRIDPNGRNVAVDEAEIVACVVTEAWEAGAPMAWDRRPGTDCDRSTPVTYDEVAGELVVDLAPLAAAWTPSANFGFSLEPGPDAGTFQVALVDAANGGIAVESDAAPTQASADARPLETAPEHGSASSAVGTIAGAPPIVTAPNLPSSPSAPGSLVTDAASLAVRGAGERPFSLRWPYAVLALASFVMPVARHGRDLLSQRRTDSDVLA